MGVSEVDHRRLSEALELAAQAIGRSDPNPRVGCIIARPDGQVIGTGSTQQTGGPHAEVMALRAARAQGHALRGATVWVTLEPCAHHGRTPPCCDALVEAGVGRVVVAVLDPFPQVAGRGIERLRAAGIQVDLAEGPVATAAQEMNIGFFSRVTRGRPWVRVKVAASMDGHTALPDGRSQWITGEAARADGHAWRKRAGAIVTGSGTVITDNPRLDVRLVSTQLQPLRVVVDGALRCPPTSRVFQPPGQVWLTTAGSAGPEAAAFEALGARVLHLPDPQDARRVHLRALLDSLGRQGINEVHVEAGAGLNGALAGVGLVDEWLVYLAPVWLGAGRAMLDLPAPPDLALAQRMDIHQLSSVGQDLRLLLRPRERRDS